MTLRAISYGGGVQSTSLLVLAATGRLDFPLFLFANVGDDSEDPRTLDYVHDVAMPYAADHGIELVEVRRKRRDGSIESIAQRIHRLGADTIPVALSGGNVGRRSCTRDWKVLVVNGELKARGATPDDKAIVGIGISLDESHRANTAHAQEVEELVYPLIGVGEETGLRLRRSDCRRIIADAGLPVPPKSSCYFCPFHRMSTWQDLRRERPDLFDKAVALEDRINSTRDERGQSHVFLSTARIPLRDAVADGAPTLFDDLEDGEGGSCDSGFCFT